MASVVGNMSEVLPYQASWKGTSSTIKDMATKFPNVGEALEAVITTTSDHCRAISMAIRNAHPCKSTDRRLVHAIVTDG
jgi:hypothetical protein